MCAILGQVFAWNPPTHPLSRYWGVVFVLEVGILAWYGGLGLSFFGEIHGPSLLYACWLCAGGEGACGVVSPERQ